MDELQHESLKLTLSTIKQRGVEGEAPLKGALELKGRPAALQRGEARVEIRDLIVEAIGNDEIPKQDVDLGTAFVLGSVMQPTTFNIYGRLTGPMIDRVPAITQAAYQALGGK